jgi:hypothetical protein
LAFFAASCTHTHDTHTSASHTVAHGGGMTPHPPPSARRARDLHALLSHLGRASLFLLLLTRELLGLLPRTLKRLSHHTTHADNSTSSAPEASAAPRIRAEQSRANTAQPLLRYITHTHTHTHRRTSCSSLARSSASRRAFSSASLLALSCTNTHTQPHRDFTWEQQQVRPAQCTTPVDVYACVCA